MNMKGFIALILVMVLDIGMVYPQVLKNIQYVDGQSSADLKNGVRFPEVETLLNYCYEHAGRPNPLQDLIDKGFLSSNLTGQTCISIKETEQKYRAALIDEITNSKCYEVWDPSVRTSQLEELFMGCERRGLIN